MFVDRDIVTQAEVDKDAKDNITSTRAAKSTTCVYGAAPNTVTDGKNSVDYVSAMGPKVNTNKQQFTAWTWNAGALVPEPKDCSAADGANGRLVATMMASATLLSVMF